jgi:hypothetical protein
VRSSQDTPVGLQPLAAVTVPGPAATLDTLTAKPFGLATFTTALPVPPGISVPTLSAPVISLADGVCSDTEMVPSVAEPAPDPGAVQYAYAAPGTVSIPIVATAAVATVRGRGLT